MLSEAINHPTYDGAAQPLVEAILGGGFNLPPELRKLSALVAQHNGQEVPPAGRNGGPSGSVPRSNQRRNIWQDEQLDMSRLKIKDHTSVVSYRVSAGIADVYRDEAISAIAGTEIPNFLKDSIARLVENQEIAEEEERRALAETRGVRPGQDMDDEDEIRRVKVAGEGDASGDEDAEGDKDKTVDVSAPQSE